jgi:ABC-2 type transport system ATP-binding protein
MIQVDGLTKLYGNKTGIEEVSFIVERGVVAGLLGPNGAGKSTIMKLLTGYITPTEGSIRVDGIDVTENPREAAMKTGYAPEIPPLYPDMTVESYLNFAADVKGVKRSERSGHVADIMEMVSVSSVKGRLLKNLSKGYRQRAGIAQALIGFPPVLILDEPTAGLDPAQTAQLRGLLRDLAGKHTIILSSHILSEISQVCGQIIIISNGRVAAQESAQNLLAGGNVFLLTLKADNGARALDCVRTVPGVVSAEAVPTVLGPLAVSSASGVGHCCLRITFEGGEEAQVALFRSLAAADLPILELRSEGQSLEQVFLRATAGILSGQSNRRTASPEGGEA